MKINIHGFAFATESELAELPDSLLKKERIPLNFDELKKEIKIQELQREIDGIMGIRMAVCSKPECCRPHYAKHLCRYHYFRLPKIKENRNEMARLRYWVKKHLK